MFLIYASSSSGKSTFVWASHGPMTSNSNATAYPPLQQLEPIIRHKRWTILIKCANHPCGRNRSRVIKSYGDSHSVHFANLAVSFHFIAHHRRATKGVCAQCNEMKRRRCRRGSPWRSLLLFKNKDGPQGLGLLMARPGFSPVGLPLSSTSLPFTITYSMPSL